MVTGWVSLDSKNKYRWASRIRQMQRARGCRFKIDSEPTRQLKKLPQDKVGQTFLETAGIGQ